MAHLLTSNQSHGGLANIGMEASPNLSSLCWLGDLSDRPLLQWLTQAGVSVPWLNFLDCLPTPVYRVPGFEHPQIYIKRDDLTDSCYGGHKMRMLEPLIGAALSRSATHILLYGTSRSEWVVPCVRICSQLGIKSIVALYRDVDPHAKENVEHVVASEAANLFVAKSKNEIGEVMRAVFGKCRGRKVFKLPLRGASPLVAAAFVNAVLEAVEQFKDLGVCCPRTVVVPLGTGGTAAGLVAGLELLELTGEVFAVKGCPFRLEAQPIRSLVDGVFRLITGKVHEVSRDRPRPVSVYETNASLSRKIGRRKVEEFAKRAGIQFDSVFTKWAIRTVLELASSWHNDGCILYWHTYSPVAFEENINASRS